MCIIGYDVHLKATIAIMLAGPIIISILIIVALGYYDNFERHNFGVLKKNGNERPLSNFSFEFVKRIVCSNSNSTGYLVYATPEEEGVGYGRVDHLAIATGIGIGVAVWPMYVYRRMLRAKNNVLQKSLLMQAIDGSYCTDLTIG